MNALQSLAQAGQSVWLDYIRKNLIKSGELQRLIDEDDLGGVTSNPSIFEKAIVGSNDYEDTLAKLSQNASLSAKDIYEHIAIGDIQAAADLLRPKYERTHKKDGYVSLEVSPYLAHDTAGTLEEARRLWRQVNRANLMIKVPGTDAGMPAIQQLIREGINVNVTLLFSNTYYEKAAQAFIDGLKARHQDGHAIDHVASVASFFISRIDTLVDGLLEEKIQKDPANKAMLSHLLGKVAISNAKLAYQRYKRLFGAEDFLTLKNSGAQEQRLLWASTSTKNPKYRDVVYVEELIGPNTVNTLPPQTFDAFRDHGRVQIVIEQNVEDAFDVMNSLEKVSISFDECAKRLTDEGVGLFADAFDKLLAAVDEKRHALEVSSALSAELPKSRLLSEMAQIEQKNDWALRIHAQLEDFTKANKLHRLWARDATLWTNQGESEWMGWLNVVEVAGTHVEHIQAFVDQVRADGLDTVVLLGMGGSSLCPQVFQRWFAQAPGYLQLRVLDSTDPSQVKAAAKDLNFDKTLFLVSSKSGSTLEPNIFKQYFYELARKKLGDDRVGSHFVAITDPGTKLEKIAIDQDFRAVFHGVPSIGGRYSALSAFGLVPAALLGIDIRRLLDVAEEMVQACTVSMLPRENPGVLLGIMLGALAHAGLNKVTFLPSETVRDLGAWLEQLLAESTGKLGKGVIPVDREPLCDVSSYSRDRVFVRIRLKDDAIQPEDRLADQLEEAGHAVIRLDVASAYHLGAEFFRWEIATATLGALLDINPFDQPDVEASKIETRRLTDAYEQTGQLEPVTMLLSNDRFFVMADPHFAGATSVLEALRSHLNRLNSGDYFGLLAFVPMTAEHEAVLNRCRKMVVEHKQVASTLGFGPRFLHSTGQAYKGGPNTGVFLQITCDDAMDVQVPEQKYTFGVVKEAQARGDFAVLSERQRRVVRIHIKGDLHQGLQELESLFAQALGR